MTKWFKESDFARANPACKQSDMNAETLAKFDQAREYAGVPFVVNSAFRTVAHEKKQGRSGTSSHTLGRAMDIRTVDGGQRYHILCGLLHAGFTRIGMAEGFIHADDSPTHTQERAWFY